MATLRVKQATLAKECGWTNSTMHGIYHGRTDYYRELVNLISSKLNIEPFELLMHPDEAMAHRRMRIAAEQMVKVPMVETAAAEPASVKRAASG